MESGGKNEGPTTTKGERRKWIGGREGERKGFAGPMSNCFLRPCRSEFFHPSLYSLLSFFLFPFFPRLPPPFSGPSSVGLLVQLGGLGSSLSSSSGVWAKS